LLGLDQQVSLQLVFFDAAFLLNSGVAAHVDSFVGGLVKRLASFRRVPVRRGAAGLEARPATGSASCISTSREAFAIGR
jgi:hypothetical protein